MTFLSWLFGVGFGAAMMAIVLAAVASGTPALIAAAIIQAVLLILAAYAFAYIAASMALAGPIAALTTAATAPNPLPNVPAERNARAFSVGLTAALNAAGAPLVVSLLFPPSVVLAPFVSGWAFVVTSLAAIPALSRNRLFQGVLGWSGWIFPMSLIANVFGFVWFVINAPFALASGIVGGGWPFRIDWSTGAIETVGGITSLISIPAAAAGTVGHFVFVLTPTFGTNPATLQQAFVVTAPPATLNVPAHETGHTLDYVAYGAARVLHALVDQVILGNLFLAYTELTADSHVPNVGRVQVRIWS